MGYRAGVAPDGRLQTMRPTENRRRSLEVARPRARVRASARSTNRPPRRLPADATHQAEALYYSYMNKTVKAAPVSLVSLLHAAYAAQAEIETKLSVVGLSLAKLLALQTLADAGESLPLGRLAERLSCVKSNITQLVDRLEADGFVAREPDPEDRRTRLAVLTTAGRRACRKGTRLQREAERTLLATLTRGEAHQLAALLEKLGKPGG
jgi:DNA-binding MarR family transcriptional regulator